MISEIFEFLKMNDVEYKGNYRLKRISPIRIGDIAAAVAYPDTEEKLVDTVKYLRKNKIKHKIVGRMSNVLPPDVYYDGVIIRTDRLDKIMIDGLKINAMCGALLSGVSQLAIQEEISGTEELSGIPGSLGGAVCGNAGAYGREIGELVSFVRFYDFAEDKILILPNSACAFSYRNSIFKNRFGIILSVVLSLSKGKRELSISRVEEFRKMRHVTQPYGVLSLGCTFKKSGDVSAGKLIDFCGLKGYSVGNAEISTVHAGFIINRGDASAYDYIRLSEYAKDSVYKKFGMKLEYEIDIM